MRIKKKNGRGKRKENILKSANGVPGVVCSQEWESNANNQTCGWATEWERRLMLEIAFT